MIKNVKTVETDIGVLICCGPVVYAATEFGIDPIGVFSSPEAAQDAADEMRKRVHAVEAEVIDAGFASPLH